MGKIVIVGSGPAGCSAALYAARAGQEVVVISMGMGALSKAELIQNYYGFEEGITGAELYRQGVAGAKAVGAEFITAEVVGLDYTGSLVVQTTEGDYPADAVILATGAGRIAPKIAGLAEHEGRGVSYCATCDAFFYRGKTAAVLGSGEYALHEVQALLPLAGKVILCTNGEPLTADFPEGGTTPVRMAVARLEFTPSMPTFARMDVSAANRAESSARPSHIPFPPVVFFFADAWGCIISSP